MTFLVAFMYILSLITIYLILVDAEQFGSFMTRNAKKIGFSNTKFDISAAKFAFKNLLLHVILFYFCTLLIDMFIKKDHLANFSSQKTVHQ